MKGLIAAFKESPERSRLLLLGLSGIVAAALGFVFTPISVASTLIQQGGYYYILVTFLAFCAYGFAIAKSRREVWSAWFKDPGIVGWVILLGCLFLYWADPFKHKILFDEYVLQGTAYHMHATKEVGALVRAYDVNGTWVAIDTFLDKRPYFFAFLVSLMHDFTGYRIANIFIVNAMMAPVFLGLVYWIVRQLAGKPAALFALALLITLPLLAQNVSSAGMEMHNLTMIVIVMTAAILYLKAPDADRLSFLVLGAVLLSQSRYESVIFVGPVALVILLGWIREKRIILSWVAVIAPLLLIPYALHNRVLSASPVLWQLNAGQTSRFSTAYLANNLQGAQRFFFNFTPAIANSWYLSVLGLLGFVAVGYRAWVWARSGPGRTAPSAASLVALLFSLGMAANLAILMFYYWSRLDDVIASRFALPMCLVLAMAAAVLVQTVELRKVKALRVVVIGLVVWYFGWDMQAIAEKQYTNGNLIMQEIDWEHDYLLTRPGRVLFVSNMSTIPFVLWHIPCILNDVATVRGSQLLYHLKAGTFSEILVAQKLTATSPQGDLGVDPRDELPEGFKLKVLRVQRFGTRITRISQLVDVVLPKEEKPAEAKPKATSVAVNP